MDLQVDNERTRAAESGRRREKGNISRFLRHAPSPFHRWGAERTVADGAVPQTPPAHIGPSQE